MQTVNVKIKGETPFIYDAPTVEELVQTTGRKGHTPEVPLEKRLHKNGHGLYIPFNMLDKSCGQAARMFKEPGRRGASYEKSYYGLVRIGEDEIPMNPREWVNSRENILARPLRRKDGNLIWKESPMLREWSAEFTFIVDEFDVDVLRQILETAGKMVGIGGWRPQCRGRFGKFSVEKFKV